MCLHKLAPLTAIEITPLQLIIKDDLILSTFSMKIQIFYVDIYLSFVLYFPFSKTKSIKITKRQASLFNVIMNLFVGLFGVFWVRLFCFVFVFIAYGEEGSLLLFISRILATS